MKKKPWIKACTNCGSGKLEWVGGGARAVFDFTGATALSGLMHCAACGRDILPVEFKSEKERKAFAKSLEKIPTTPEPTLRPTAPDTRVNLARGYTETVLSVMALGSFFLGAFLLLQGNLIGSAPAMLLALLLAFLARRAR